MNPDSTGANTAKSVHTVSYLLSGLLVLSIAVNVAMTRYQSTESTDPSDSYGELLAAAIRELFLGQPDTGAVDKIRGVRHHAIHDGKLATNEDPFPGWLAAQLIKRAIDGTLFIRDDNGVSLRITWDMGDTAYWYVASVSVLKHDGSRAVTNGPWVLWRSLGIMVTPKGPDDKPWVTDYKLLKVSPGDIIVLDVFCLPRDFVDIVERLDPALATEDDAARLILRLSLPVIVKPD